MLLQDETVSKCVMYDVSFDVPLLVLPSQPDSSLVKDPMSLLAELPQPTYPRASKILYTEEFSDLRETLQDAPTIVPAP